MELRQLQYFLAIAECGSLSKAATVIGVAQPALSRTLRQLEEDVGAPLFYRNGRGVRLTDQGVQFQITIAPLVRDILQARDSIRDSAGVLAGSIAFGMPPSFSGVIGAHLVEIFLKHHPKVKLQIMEGFSGYIFEWLVSGRVDMAIINDATVSANIPLDPLLTVSLFHVAHRETASIAGAKGREVVFATLAGAPLVLPGRHHGLRRQIDSIAQKLGIDLNVVAEIDALDTIYDFVHRGLASTILPHGAINRQSLQTELLVRRIAKPDVTMQFQIAYSLDRPITPAMRELARLVRNEVAHAVEKNRLYGSLPRN